VPSRIRVLQVTNSLNYGGLERLVVDICTNIDRTQFEPSIACLKYPGNLASEAEQAGVPIWALNEEVVQHRKYSNFRRLQNLIRREGIDVVHTHNTGPLIDAFLARCTQIADIPVIHTDHTRPVWPDRKLYMRLERLASFWVRGFVAVSEEAKTQLVRHARIAERRIQVLDNGVNVTRFHEPTMPAREWLRQFDADHFEFIVGVLAMHRRQKGITHFLKAIPSILEEFPRAGFIIGGGGPLRKEHMAEAEQLGISANTRFIGRRGDVADALWAMDIYVLPSESEGLPIGLLEAMAARRCIVATAVGAVPEVLEQGACGQLIQPKSPGEIADAVRALLRDPARRKALGERAYERVEQEYSIVRTVQSYQALYQAALHGHVGSSVQGSAL
jgi:glycosyltransferase involved in cell wall biosynthesis